MSKDFQTHAVSVKSSINKICIWITNSLCAHFNLVSGTVSKMRNDSNCGKCAPSWPKYFHIRNEVMLLTWLCMLCNETQESQDLKCQHQSVSTSSFCLCCYRFYLENKDEIMTCKKQPPRVLYFNFALWARIQQDSGSGSWTRCYQVCEPRPSGGSPCAVSGQSGRLPRDPGAGCSPELPRPQVLHPFSMLKTFQMYPWGEHR